MFENPYPLYNAQLQGDQDAGSSVYGGVMQMHCNRIIALLSHKVWHRHNQATISTHDKRLIIVTFHVCL